MNDDSKQLPSVSLNWDPDKVPSDYESPPIRIDESFGNIVGLVTKSPAGIAKAATSALAYFSDRKMRAFFLVYERTIGKDYEERWQDFVSNDKNRAFVFKILEGMRTTDSIWATCCLATLCSKYSVVGFLDEEEHNLLDILCSIRDRDLEFFVRLGRVRDDVRNGARKDFENKQKELRKSLEDLKAKHGGRLKLLTETSKRREQLELQLQEDFEDPINVSVKKQDLKQFKLESKFELGSLIKTRVETLINLNLVFRVPEGGFVSVSEEEAVCKFQWTEITDYYRNFMSSHEMIAKKIF